MIETKKRALWLQAVFYSAALPGPELLPGGRGGPYLLLNDIVQQASTGIPLSANAHPA